MNDGEKRGGIKTWADDDRPREKLMLKGKSALSDAELIAILLGSGTHQLSAVELAQQILSSTRNNLVELSKLSISELKKFKGVGTAKAIAIAAALELGRRKRESETISKKSIFSSKDVDAIFRPILENLAHEELWVLYLNRANKILGKTLISKGGVSATVADSKLIFKQGLDYLASAMVLCHNHPSGSTKPSQEDKELTIKLIKGGKLMDMRVLDHIIITETGYFSFQDEGIM